MKPIAIFYHCVFVIDDRLLESAVAIADVQIQQMAHFGLTDAASEFHVGVNGGLESSPLVDAIFPPKAKINYHGDDSRAENLTIAQLEEWAKSHPGWNVLYFHCKGATHDPGNPYGENVSKPWRQTMMHDLVDQWRHCVHFLDSNDIVCSRWLWNQADGSQHIPAGNFLWVTSDFVTRLPSIYLRERIKVSGISAAESRYEAEVYWGNGPRPKVFQWRPNGGGGVP
jgi:hypothetical protein